MPYVGYRPSFAPLTPDQVKPLTDQLYSRLDKANDELDRFPNALINGAFEWNQRSGTYTAGASAFLYTFDRWAIGNLGPNGSNTLTAQSFAFGDIASESRFFARVACTGHTAVSDGATLYQPVEGVRRFAGRRVVIRGMARRNSGAGSIAVELQQNFGTPSATTFTYAGTFTPAAVWAPFSLVVNVPALTAAQTLGTGGGDCLSVVFFLSAGSNFNARTNNLGLQTQAVDFADLEVKEVIPGYGDQSPGFERVPREIELLRCMRYYETGNYDILYNATAASGFGSTYVGFLAAKRVTPTIAATSTYASNCGAITARIIGASSAQIYVSATAAGNTENSGSYTLAAEF